MITLTMILMGHTYPQAIFAAFLYDLANMAIGFAIGRQVFRPNPKYAPIPIKRNGTLRKKK